MADTIDKVEQQERLRCYRAAKLAIEEGLFCDEWGNDMLPVPPGSYVIEKNILARLSLKFEDMARATPRRGRKVADARSPVGSPAGGGE